MLRNLALLTLLCCSVAACRGKKANEAEAQAAEGSEPAAAPAEARPAPLQPDVEHPPVEVVAEASGSGLAVPSQLDRSFQLRRPNLTIKPMVGAQSITHDLRARTNAAKIHNSGIRVLMPKAVGAQSPSATPAPLAH